MSAKKIGEEKLIIGGVILLVVFVIIAFILLGRGEDKRTVLENKMNDIAAKFYEEKYYPIFSDKQRLADYKNTGINVNIDSINVLVPVDDELKNLLDEYECHFSNSFVRIYPKAPYGKKDYNLKVELACKK